MWSIFWFLIIVVCCKDSASSYYAPSMFVNHGAGPLPVLGDKYHKPLTESLKNVSQYVDFNRVQAIIVVTAHREEDIVTISSGQRHEMLYDYYDFPPESFSLKHGAPGAPELARSVHAACIRAGINARLDPVRGWDHGVFIPMILVDPAGRIPVLQISILNNHNASQHFELGRVLRPFREQGVAILGSGMSYHNMKSMATFGRENDGIVVNEDFADYLIEVCTGNDLKKILAWEDTQGAREAHPEGKEEHLMPLIVNMGAAGSKRGKKILDSVFVGKFRLNGFNWD